MKRFRILLILAVSLSMVAGTDAWTAGPATAQRKAIDWSAPAAEDILPNPTRRVGGRPYLRMFGPSVGGKDAVVGAYSNDAVDINGQEITNPGAGGRGGGDGAGIEAGGSAPDDDNGPERAEAESTDGAAGGADAAPVDVDQEATSESATNEDGATLSAEPGSGGEAAGEDAVSEQGGAGTAADGSAEAAPNPDGGADGSGAEGQTGSGAAGAAGPDLSGLDWQDSQEMALLQQLSILLGDDVGFEPLGSPGSLPAERPWRSEEGDGALATGNAPAGVTGGFGDAPSGQAGGVSSGSTGSGVSAEPDAAGRDIGQGIGGDGNAVDGSVAGSGTAAGSGGTSSSSGVNGPSNNGSARPGFGSGTGSGLPTIGGGFGASIGGDSGISGDGVNGPGAGGTGGPSGGAFGVDGIGEGGAGGSSFGGSQGSSAGGASGSGGGSGSGSAMSNGSGSGGAVGGALGSAAAAGGASSNGAGSAGGGGIPGDGSENAGSSGTGPVGGNGTGGGSSSDVGSDSGTASGGSSGGSSGSGSAMSNGSGSGGTAGGTMGTGAGEGGGASDGSSAGAGGTSNAGSGGSGAPSRGLSDGNGTGGGSSSDASGGLGTGGSSGNASGGLGGGGVSGDGSSGVSASGNDGSSGFGNAGGNGGNTGSGIVGNSGSGESERTSPGGMSGGSSGGSGFDLSGEAGGGASGDTGGGTSAGGDGGIAGVGGEGGASGGSGSGNDMDGSSGTGSAGGDIGGASAGALGAGSSAVGGGSLGGSDGAAMGGASGGSDTSGSDMSAGMAPAAPPAPEPSWEYNAPDTGGSPTVSFEGAPSSVSGFSDDSGGSSGEDSVMSGEMDGSFSGDAGASSDQADGNAAGMTSGGETGEGQTDGAPLDGGPSSVGSEPSADSAPQTAPSVEEPEAPMEAGETPSPDVEAGQTPEQEDRTEPNGSPPVDIGDPVSPPQGENLPGDNGTTTGAPITGELPSEEPAPPSDTGGDEPPQAEPEQPAETPSQPPEAPAENAVPGTTPPTAPVPDDVRPPLVLAELNANMAALSDANRAMGDFIAVKTGQARAEDFTGDQRDDLNVLMEMDKRTGGLDSYVRANIAKLENLEQDMNETSAGLQAQSDADIGLAQGLGTALTAFHTADAALKAAAASGYKPAIALEKVLTMSRSATEKVMAAVDSYGKLSAPETGGAGQQIGGTSISQAGSPSASPGSLSGRAGSGPENPATPSNNYENIGKLPSEAKSVAGTIGQIRQYNATGKAEDLNPSPKSGEPVSGSAAAGKVAGLVQKGAAFGDSFADFRKAQESGNQDAINAAGIRALQSGARVGKSAVETIDSVQAWRDGKAIDKSGKTITVFETIDRGLSVEKARRAIDKFRAAKTPQEREAALNSFMQEAGNVALGDKGSKAGKSVVEAAGYLRRARDAFDRGDSVDGAINSAEALAKYMNANAVFLAEGQLKYKVDTGGRAFQAAADAGKTGRSVYELQQLRNQIAKVLKFESSRRSVGRNKEKLQKMMLWLKQLEQQKMVQP